MEAISILISDIHVRLRQHLCVRLSVFYGASTETEIRIFACAEFIPVFSIFAAKPVRQHLGRPADHQIRLQAMPDTIHLLCDWRPDTVYCRVFRAKLQPHADRQIHARMRGRESDDLAVLLLASDF